MKDLLFFLIGLIIFLTGIYLFKWSLKYLGNVNIRKALNRFTGTPLIGCIFSTLLTMLLQSSSLITVITIGLVDTGIITFKQAIGVILGSNIGTTITAQIMAFNLEKWYPLILLIGIIFLIFPLKKIRYVGINLIGLSFIFSGMNVMSQAFLTASNYNKFYHLLRLTSSNTLLALFLGIVITALIQSSSAMTGIVLVLAKNNQIDLISATGIILGSNIGTCITAILASIGSTLGGKRVAAAHVILNLLGVMIFFPFIQEFSYFISLFSKDLPRQIAHIHTIFNIICSLAVLPFSNIFSQFVCWLVKE